ncbi:hypothetical protein VQL36_16230 [Chengkuizengella sp. SCS-71B]|uniref:hypothetical protein n=1 Tax=Chengkuizengella sp. SCS-71B TaxID=3115290 RepID=UPI0032C212A7
MSDTMIQNATVRLNDNTVDFIFPSRVLSAEVVLKGFNLNFGAVNGSREILLTKVEAVLNSIADNVVTASVVGELNDGRGNTQNNDLSTVTITCIAIVL